MRERETESTKHSNLKHKKETEKSWVVFLAVSEPVCCPSKNKNKCVGNSVPNASEYGYKL